MPTMTIQEAQARLTDLIDCLPMGDELVITENNEPIAKVVRTAHAKCKPCRAGSAQGKIHFAPDFDGPLEEFKEYN